MKCPDCHKNMKVTLGMADLLLSGSMVHVIRFPVLACPICGKRIVHDILLKRAESYALRYGRVNDVLDFGACEEMESEASTLAASTQGR